MRRATAEFVVNDYVRYDQQSPDITALADGGFVVVFQSAGRGPYGFPDIYAQRFDAQANPIGGEFQVNETTGQSRTLPHVSARDDGGFIVSWDSASNGDISWDVNARAFSADGTPLGHEFLVNTDTNNAQQYNSVVALAGDAFAIAYHNDDDLSSRVAYFSGLGAVPDQGSALGHYFTGERNRYFTATARLHNGGYVSVTDFNPVHQSSSGQERDIFANIFNADGQLQTSFTANARAFATQTAADVAVLNDGNIVITWESDGQDGDLNGIYGREFSTTGQPLGNEFLINTTTAGSQDFPSVTATADGGFFVAWSGDHDAESEGIFGQRYDSEGQRVGGEFLINEFQNGLQFEPQVTSLENGAIVVTWTSQGNDGPFVLGEGYGYGIAATLFKPELYGTGHDDVIRDTIGANWINGQAGNDALYGGAGRDHLFGNSGDDRLFGGTGNDILNGGAGHDHLAGGAGIDTASYAGAGTAVLASLINAAANAGAAAGDSYVSIENLLGSAHGDKLVGDGGANRIDGAGGNDHLFGGGGADVLVGGAGKDTINGGAGKDQLFGQAGADRLVGAFGHDVLVGGAGGDVLDGGAGRDAASYGDAGARVTASLANAAINTGFAAGDIFVHIENLIGSRFGDRLIGDNGANVLVGNAGNDHLRGLAGADRLEGGAGADVLDGGTGRDRLIGGGGADTFVFHAHGGHDRITDFSLAQNDQLQIASALAGAGTTAADLAAAASVTSAGVEMSFADGTTILLDELASTDGLVDHILIAG